MRPANKHTALGERPNLKIESAILIDNNLDRFDLGRPPTVTFDGIAAGALSANDIQVPGVIGNLVLNPLKLRARVEQQTERNAIVQFAPMSFNRYHLFLIKRGVEITRLHARLDHQKDAVVRKLRECHDLARLAHIGHKVRHGMLTSIAHVAPKDRVALLGSRGVELQLELGYGNVSQAAWLITLRLHDESPPSSPD